jgi:sugar lactone lactonase YvrE
MTTVAGGLPAGVNRIEADLFVEYAADVGEGPLWDDRDDCLWWVDIPNKTVHRTDPTSGRTDVIEVDEQIGALALRESGGLVAAFHDGFGILDEAIGKIKTIAPVEAEDRSTRMNDGKVDPDGRFWAGTTGLDHRPDAGTLYRLGPDLTVTPMLSDLTVSNGLGWSPDGTTMYFIDSTTRCVDAFAFDRADGTISDRRTVVAVREGAGWPDGMTVDAEGFLWVALWGGWAVERYAPDGRLDLRVDVPVEQPASCAFGGRELGTLYITTAAKGLPTDGDPAQPLAGSLFMCEPGPRGRRSTRFGG